MKKWFVIPAVLAMSLNVEFAEAGGPSARPPPSAGPTGRPVGRVSTPPVPGPGARPVGRTSTPTGEAQPSTQPSPPVAGQARPVGRTSTASGAAQPSTQPSPPVAGQARSGAAPTEGQARPGGTPAAAPGQYFNAPPAGGQQRSGAQPNGGQQAGNPPRSGQGGQSAESRQVPPSQGAAQYAPAPAPNRQMPAAQYDRPDSGLK